MWDELSLHLYMPEQGSEEKHQYLIGLLYLYRINYKKYFWKSTGIYVSLTWGDIFSKHIWCPMVIKRSYICIAPNWISSTALKHSRTKWWEMSNDNLVFVWAMLTLSLTHFTLMTSTLMVSLPTTQYIQFCLSNTSLIIRTTHIVFCLIDRVHTNAI